jgi:two-component system chemotaxis response regulator CheY
MAEPKLARIVIVDDNAVVREVLRGMIGRDDRLKLVGQAATGEGAIDLVKSLNPDLVCLDVMLPGVDGLEVLRAIRAAHPDIKVILVSGHSTSDVVESAMKSGASGFIVKPFNANKLLQTIHSVLASPVPVKEAEPAKADPPPPAEPGKVDAAAVAEPAKADVAAAGEPAKAEPLAPAEPAQGEPPASA